MVMHHAHSHVTHHQATVEGTPENRLGWRPVIIAGAPTSIHDPVVLVHSLRAIVLPLHPSAWPEVQRVLVFLARDFVNNPG